MPTVANQIEMPYAGVIMAQVSQLYAGVIMAQNEHPYASVVRASNEQPIYYTVAGALEHPYSLRAVVKEQSDKPYDLKLLEPVGAANEQPFTALAQGSLSTPYEPSVVVRADNDQEYSEHSIIQTQNSQKYEDTTVVASGIENPWSLNTDVASQIEYPYEATQTVKGQNSEDYDLLLLNPVKAQVVEYYDLLAVTIVNITDIPIITYGADTIQILEASISQDEEDYAWKASITLASIGDYQKMSNGDAFILNLLGEEYNLIVDSKSLFRNAPAEVSLTLSGISPTVRFDNPNADKITKTWETPILAKDAAEEVLGESITWTLPNWMIQANRLAVVDASPISIVQLIATAAGGVVETQPDGTVAVRPKYPVSVADFATAALDHTLTDAADNLSTSEKLQQATVINKLRILYITYGK